ncbi:DUF3164 family protein [Sedimenticola selenatireducens]|uniref:DUF3164 family protein n=1 Tax=Sedimenticola selenatireducens TaxID=191960 RepID=A0A557S0J3_9GAMM|nr:DUF3164 family protein [Sedimenticola selenatireducens]TVO70868.1 DUF3164 family protein [Sedimenticola selenatireducens]
MTIPAGYRQNAQGHLVPIDSIAEIDLDRDALVDEVFQAAEQLRLSMADFKAKAMGDVEAFVELAAEKYDAKLGGLKGNLSLTSFDGRKKVQISIGDTIAFDERLTIAKALVDECIHEWTEGSSSEIKTLVEHAFQTDKEGKINTGRILGLTRLAIEHPKWKQAMEAIRDSLMVVSSKSYIRLYTRPTRDQKFQQIGLDMASV